MAHVAHTDHPAATQGLVPEALLTLTDKAVEMVKQTMTRDGLGGDYGMRVRVEGGGCSGFQYALNFDNAVKDDDRVIEQDGVRVFVDAMSGEYLKGMTIDYVAGLHGAGFKFLNPQAKSTCGCGSSFSV